MQPSTEKQLYLPKWIKDIDTSSPLKTDKAKMDFCIDLANRNIQNNTGGPFGAAIFNMETDELISIGVNVVVEQTCSSAHAEVIALMLAQEKIKNHRLEPAEYVIFSSAQPCIMCFGAVMWSGVKKLIFGATKADVESITGFDEGPSIPNWDKELIDRNIEVVSGYMREAACTVLTDYKSMNGIIY